MIDAAFEVYLCHWDSLTGFFGIEKTNEFLTQTRPITQSLNVCECEYLAVCFRGFQKHTAFHDGELPAGFDPGDAMSWAKLSHEYVMSLMSDWEYKDFNFSQKCVQFVDRHLPRWFQRCSG